MGFNPRMTARHAGISVLGAPRAHVSEDGLVEVWRAHFSAGASGDYVSLDPRLFIILDPLDAEIALDGAGETPARSRTRSASFLPAGAPLHVSADRETRIRHLDLHFDARLVERAAPGGLNTPRLLFNDPRVMRLASLLERACGDGGANTLYGDDLVSALIAAAFAPAGRFPRAALSDRQLRTAIDHIEAHCSEPIRLETLAELVGLSDTYFSHAFKAATGVPPHRWQMQARVRRAQDALLRTDDSLTKIAMSLGFSDQPHFTRVFRALTGATPAAWRAERRRVVR